jgi:ribosomal protein S18 acetylase RimI-like enzyme
MDVELAPNPELEIRPLSGAEIRERAAELGAVLADCVAGGAPIGPMLPFPDEDARGYWDGVAAAVDAGTRCCVAAVVDGRAQGAVQIDLATPANQPHRAVVSMLIVHRGTRNRGIGQGLLKHAEVEGALHGRTLLTFETAAESEAERLASHLGWLHAGTIPACALFPTGGYVDVVVLWKAVGGPEGLD